MAWSDEDERELRHIAAMIDVLCRLDVDEREAAATVVMHTAYWRARVDGIRRKQRVGERVSTLTKILLERLDQLDARKSGRVGAHTTDARQRGRRGGIA
jgi:hypothetical protein